LKKKKMCRQKAAARTVMTQPGIETGTKTSPKGLNQRIGNLPDLSEDEGYYIATARIG
jgi:hypothetical protein